MLESVRNGNRFQYKKLTEDEKQNRHILGTLVGPMADIENPTRNGRQYTEELWENIFGSPLVKEKFRRGGIPGELEHPADRDEVDPEKIAVMMPEPPKKSTDDGLLYGYWHILDTPCGKILKTLVDYGYQIGVSTRGNGDVIDDGYGNEQVDPNTYMLNAIDVVLIPAVEKATVGLAESLDTKKSLKESLTELVNNSTDNDKKIMNESLAQLNITLTSENAGEAREVSIPVDMTVSDNGDVNIETVDTIPEDDPGVIGETPEVTVTADVVMQAQSEVEQEVEAEVADDTVDNSTEDDNINADGDEEDADDVGDSLFSDLQEALKERTTLKKTNEKLKAELSVGYTKEQQLNEELNRCKAKIRELVESTKVIHGLNVRSSVLEENNKSLSESIEQINRQKTKAENLYALSKVNSRQIERQRDNAIANANRQSDKLKEALAEKESMKRSYEEQIKRLNESIEQIKSEQNEKLIEHKQSVEEKENELNRRLQSAQKKYEILFKEHKNAEAKLSQITESYARDMCKIKGLDYSEIKDRIQNCSADEIRSLTESYAQRRMVEKKLPFSTSSVKKINYTRPQRDSEHRINTNSDDIAEWEINEKENY